MVGTSGNAFDRLAPNKASGFALPPLICARQADTDDTITCELLPSSVVSAGPPPLVGRWRSFKPPAAFIYSAVGICSAPYSPDELKMISSGRFWASSVRSLSVLYGCWSLTMITQG